MMNGEPKANGPDVFLYSPINVIKPAGENLWVVDGPEIGFGFGGLIPFPTRMTVVKMASGGLILHSPVEHTAGLERALLALGPIRYLVAPNSLHYWWVPDWAARLPDAKVLAVKGLDKRAHRPLRIDAVLTETSPWPDDIDLTLISGHRFIEAALFHRVSRTLILTDLIENFEPKRIRNWFYRQLIRTGGVADPDGKAPIDMRLSFLRHRRALRSAVREMIGWNPKQIIIAHGRCYETGAAVEQAGFAPMPEL
jgi:hypothetical protein